MNNNQFRKQEFEKRRVFKKGTSLCNAYSCPIFQNCLLEIKQLQQENKQLKIQISAREEVCNRLENNWNKLKEIAKSQSGFKKRVDLKGGLWFEVDDLLDKMQELERSDNQ